MTATTIGICIEINRTDSSGWQFGILGNWTKSKVFHLEFECSSVDAGEDNDPQEWKIGGRRSDWDRQRCLNPTWEGMLGIHLWRWRGSDVGGWREAWLVEFGVSKVYMNGGEGLSHVYVSSIEILFQPPLAHNFSNDPKKFPAHWGRSISFEVFLWTERKGDGGVIGYLSNAILAPFVSQTSPADILTLIDEEETTILSLNQPVRHNVILYGKGQ